MKSEEVTIWAGVLLPVNDMKASPLIQLRAVVRDEEYVLELDEGEEDGLLYHLEYSSDVTQKKFLGWHSVPGGSLGEAIESFQQWVSERAQEQKETGR